MASPKRLLQTTSNFDEAVTVHAQDIIAVIKDETVGDRNHTFYLYQDFSTSETLFPEKEKILISVYNRNDLSGWDSALQRVHYIRSRCYKQMADERTLAYFNIIKFQS